MSTLSHSLSMFQVQRHSAARDANLSTMVLYYRCGRTFVVFHASRQERQLLFHVADVCVVYDVLRGFELALAAVPYEAKQSSGGTQLDISDRVRHLAHVKNLLLVHDVQ